MPLKMTIPELEQFLQTEFPQVGAEFRILSLAENTAQLEMVIAEQNLRPGGTVSGPSMFALADLAFYIALLAMIGPKALAVTTNASIDFMRKPSAGLGLVGTARILKLGRVLAVGDVLICSKGQDQPVARASLTYAIPPR